MKASELIEKLQQLIDEHGDLEVVSDDNKNIYDVSHDEATTFMKEAIVIEF